MKKWLLFPLIALSSYGFSDRYSEPSELMERLDFLEENIQELVLGQCLLLERQYQMLLDLHAIKKMSYGEVDIEDNVPERLPMGIRPDHFDLVESTD